VMRISTEMLCRRLDATNEILRRSLNAILFGPHVHEERREH
jgi:hypothetical protein